jgi:hypothetical protein
VWPADPVLLRLGPLELRGSGALLAAGLVLGYLAVRSAAARQGIAAHIVRDLALWSLPEGLLAARVAYILVHPEIYLIAPTRVVHLWDGGFAFGAGLVVGVLAAWRFARRRGLPFGRLADAAVPGLLLAQALALLGGALGASPALGFRLFQELWALGLLALYAVVRSRWRPGLVFLGYLELQALGQVALVLLGNSTDVGGVLGAMGWVAVVVTAGLAALYHLRSNARRAMRDE